MSISNENNRFSITRNLGDVSADANTLLFSAERKFKVTRLVINVGTTATANDSNYAVFDFKNETDDIGSYSTKLTGGDGTITADTPVYPTVSETYEDIAAAGKLFLDVDITGTFTLADMFVQVDGYYL